MKWISVKDKLPDKYEDVLIYPRPTPSARVGYCDHRGKWNYEVGEYDNPCIVTHWMYLPENPKEEE